MISRRVTKLIVACVASILLLSVTVFAGGSRIEFQNGEHESVILENDDILETRSRINTITENLSGNLVAGIATAVPSGAASGSPQVFTHVHAGGSGETDSYDACHTSSYTTTGERYCGATFYYQWILDSDPSLPGYGQWFSTCSQCGAVYAGKRMGAGCGNVVGTYSITKYTLTCADTNKSYGRMQIFNSFPQGGGNRDCAVL